MGLFVRFCSAAAIAATTTHLLAGVVGVVPDEVVIKVKKEAAEAAVQAAFKAEGAQHVDSIDQIGVRVLHVPEARRDKVIEALSHNPNIEFAEPNNIYSADATVNDPWFSSEWHLSKIEAPAAWDSTTGSTSVTVAILDTGVESTHPDLKPKLVPGWNFYDNNSNTSDVYGHGTAVAGTAAAQGNNGVGVAGVAYNVKIMPLRVSDVNGYAYDTTISKALTYAADHGCRVANISFRASNSSSVSSSAQYMMGKGGVTTISSGNDGVFDATADNPYILTVSATDQNDLMASWSNTGNNVDVAAPGVSILTTSTGANYGYWSGTSFSAPIVAGVAALVISANPNLTGSDVQKIIKQNADDKGATGYDTQYGYGRVNAKRAVAAALGIAPAPSPTPTGDTTAPTIQITSPAPGSTVKSTVSVKVTTSDNVGVKKVELYVDGVLKSTSTAAPFTTSWDTRSASKGAHTIKTIAYDAAGNIGSASETVYK